MVKSIMPGLQLAKIERKSLTSDQVHIQAIFSLIFCDFSELCQFCCSACVLSAISWSKHEIYGVHTEENREFGIYLKIWEKTEYLMNTLYIIKSLAPYSSTLLTCVATNQLYILLYIWRLYNGKAAEQELKTLQVSLNAAKIVW